MKRLLFVLSIAFGLQVVNAAVIINEFLASNSAGLQDPDEPGQYPDWIELYNSGDQNVALGGYYLTDNPARLTKWRIPDGLQIAAKGFLLFIADGEIEQGARHTNFKLNSTAGYVGLVAGAGTVVDSLTYGKQFTDVSYGRSPDGGADWLYFESPTPNASNSTAGFIGKIEKVQYSHRRGFYESAFDLILTNDNPNAKIYYTVDGSDPGVRVGGGTMLYSKPIRITTTSHVRAYALLDGWQSKSSVTHTYIFIKDVIAQPKIPDGFPQNWGWTGLGDYEMDPRVVNHPDYKNTIIDDMISIPTMSLVMDVDDWFGEGGQGIYIQGELDERAVSAEVIHPDGAEGVQINCSVMIVGGTSPNRWKMDKLSMRLKFKRDYGPARLQYPLFGEDATDEFQTVVLDARMNNSWAYGGGVGIDGRNLKQNDIAQYTRDNFVAELQKEMGGLGPSGRQMHLYLNGLYWGLYWVHERPDEHFAASYRGGTSDDYDVIKHNANSVVNGSNDHYKQMFSIANSGRPISEKYDLLDQYLDIPDFINYMIVNFYVGNVDWAHQNWYATRAKSGPESKWRYHSWDAEHVMEGLHSNSTVRDNDGGPTRLHHVLKQHPTYQRQFADQVYSQLFNNGILTVERVMALYRKFLDEVDRAVVGESARWGDNHRDDPYTRNVEWVRERDWLLNTYFPQRGAIVLEQLRSQGLFPQAEAPVFKINGAHQHGGRIDKGAYLSMTATGEIYFTANGADPLVSDAAGKNQQIIVAQSADKRAFVPTANIGIRWRAEQDYNDADWLICRGAPGGIGYDNDSEYNQFITLNVRDQMYDPNNAKPTSCLIRIPFELTAEQLSAIQTLSLNMRYDDGFFAFLNGTLIASANAPDSPVWNAAALSAREAGSVEAFNVSNFVNRLRVGKNLLAIHGLNVHSRSSDFLITAELAASDQGGGGSLSPHAQRYTEPIVLDRSVAVSARSLKGGEWSPLNATVFAVPDMMEKLCLTEIHYNPLDDEHGAGKEYEFLELKNIGPQAVDLSLGGFVRGVRYTFNVGVMLDPGQFLVLASNTEAFKRRYGFAPFGAYDGNLDNAGERILFANAAGDTILNVRYNDKSPWPEAADGAGYSLAAKEVNPLGNPALPDYWRASFSIHGSPGRDDKIATEIASDAAAPVRHLLHQNFPNPFNAATTIRFELPVSESVKLTVYNVLGQQAVTIIDRRFDAGIHTITWDAADLAGGVYFYKLQAGEFTSVRKLLLVK